MKPLILAASFILAVKNLSELNKIFRFLLFIIVAPLIKETQLTIFDDKYVINY